MRRDVYNPRLKRFEVAIRKPERRIIITWQTDAKAAREFAESKGLQVVWVQLRPVEKDMARL